MPNSIDSETLSSLGLGGRSQAATADNELGQDEFMRLMVTQLRNQDPFAPMESGEFLGQLAQFGTVSGIDEVRGALDSLAGAMAANQTMQAAGLVDRQAYVPAREAWLPPEGEVRGAVDVPAGVANATVGIYDMNGRLVATRPVADAGDEAGEFVWDGSLPEGDEAESGYYELRASGDVGGASVALDVLVSGRVESVSLGGAGGAIELTVTGLGRVDLADVRRVSSLNN
jgi:flagellar basal-body rod modification protein FlgD